MGATEKIARFIVETDYEDIPRDAVEKAKRTTLDCMGAALAGVAEPVSQTITGYVTKARRAVPGIPIWRWPQSFGSRGCPGQWRHCPRPGLR